MDRLERDKQVDLRKKQLRERWAHENPKVPTMTDDELNATLEQTQKMTEKMPDSKVVEMTLRWTREEMQKSARLNYFWSTYTFPRAIRVLRDKYLIGRRFTESEVKRELESRGLPESAFRDWLENQAIENRHYQIVDRAKWINNEITYIFI